MSAVKPREGGLFSVAGLVGNSRILNRFDVFAVVVVPPWVVSRAAGIVVGRKAPGSLDMGAVFLDENRIDMLSVTGSRQRGVSKMEKACVMRTTQER